MNNSSNNYKGILMVISFAIFMFVFYKFIKHRIDVSNEKFVLVDGTKDAKLSSVITQDPKNENSITLYRSENQDKGIEFSYICWFLINDMHYKFGEWKHIFHKGNKSSYPNRAPGVFIHESDNKIRIYMNSIKDILEYVDIDNIPLKKWVHLGVVLDGKYLDIYINGKLRTRYMMKGVPKQNFGDLWINLFGGFDGYISNLTYYRRALSYSEIDKIVKEGPSKKMLNQTKIKPPYLEDNWWFSN